MIHGNRRLLRRLKAVTQQPTNPPMQLATVQSSSVGQSTVVLAGDPSQTSIPAFNYAHTTSLAEGTLVHVQTVGHRLFVVGAMP